MAIGKTARRTWQLFESRAARFFGAERAVLSGSSGRSDRSMSDSTHPRLYIECKLAASHAVRTLWDATAKHAAGEDKRAVVLLADKHKEGFLIVVHSNDWAAVAQEWVETWTRGSGTCKPNENPPSS